MRWQAMYAKEMNGVEVTMCPANWRNYFKHATRSENAPQYDFGRCMCIRCLWYLSRLAPSVE
jgi:hypothetical protein